LAKALVSLGRGILFLGSGVGEIFGEGQELIRSWFALCKFVELRKHLQGIVAISAFSGLPFLGPSQR
jgi:hypothetical protein